jgi:transcriptional regulator with XRE-family HTH domain
LNTTPASPLAIALRRLRDAAGLNQTEAAAKAGTTQATVSRAERGHVTPSPDVVAALCRVYRAPAALRQRLVKMAEDAQTGTVNARTVLQRGGPAMQEKIGRLEESSFEVVEVYPTVMPGLVQTPAYAAALFGDSVPAAERDRIVEVRMSRKWVLTSERSFTFALTEGALRWCMGSPTVMVEQLGSLAELSQRPNVRVGVVPFGTPANVSVLHPWVMYDERMVVVGTIDATAFIPQPDAIAAYRERWKEIKPLFVWGDEAQAVIAQVRADFDALIIR